MRGALGGAGVRDGAEGFFRTVAWCWRQPRLLLVELLWRWSCGALLLALAGWQGWRIAEAVRPAVQATGLFRVTLESAMADPEPAARAFNAAVGVVQPPLTHAVVGLAPLALFLWCAAFGVGRTALLRRYDPALRPRRFLLAVCEGLRLMAMTALGWAWYAGVSLAGRVAFGQGEPNLPLYAASVIALSLGAYVLWSLLGWVLVATPLVGILGGFSVPTSLRHGFALRRGRRKLLDVSLLMGVVKLALLVLAAVISASPLPFADAVSGWPVYAWYAVVSLLYLAASDFFKVARFVAFLEFCRGELVH